MAKKAPLNAKSVDSLLKSMLVFSRTVEHVLEERAVDAVTSAPLSSSKVQILRLLGHKGTQTSTQLARFLGVSKPAVSQLVESMVKSKLVSRRTATADRREVNLRLTARGLKLFQSLRQQQRHTLRNTLRGTSGVAADRWKTVLQDLSTSLAQADQAYQHFCAQCGAHEDGTCVLVGGDAECVYLQHRPRATRRKTARARR